MSVQKLSPGPAIMDYYNKLNKLYISRVLYSDWDILPRNLDNGSLTVVCCFHFEGEMIYVISLPMWV